MDGRSGLDRAKRSTIGNRNVKRQSGTIARANRGRTAQQTRAGARSRQRRTNHVPFTSADAYCAEPQEGSGGMSKGSESAPGIGTLLARAYGAERTRICHVLKALECAQDGELRDLWHKRLELARSRADMLARMLARCEDQPAAEPRSVGDCLLEAMELALRNGDLVAAEAVARECVAL